MHALGDLPPIAQQVVARNLTYLSAHKLANLIACARAIDVEGVPGVLVEAGVALGGSTAVLAATCPTRELHGYDVFGMIPPPGENDGDRVHRRYAEIAAGKSRGLGGEQYYGYRTDLQADVERALTELGLPVGERIHLHAGVLDYTFDPPAPIALAHIDVDWYASVKVALERIVPRLAPGGFLVCDDYFFYEGARLATDEVLANVDNLEPIQDDKHLILRCAG